MFRLVALALSLAAVVTHAQEAPRKKLVEYGWDVPYPEYVRQHIRQMEKRPFDGLVFRLREFDHAFDPRGWDEAQMQPQLEELGRIDWGRFTDNFLCLHSANAQGMDWADDQQWQVIQANLRLFARAARAGRCVGVCFDPEPYGPSPWVYQGGPGRPDFAPQSAQVRRRGAQFIAALQQEMPELRLLTFFQLSLFASSLEERDPLRRETLLSRHPYGFLPAFLEGMLDAIGPGVRIIDGNEGSYYYDKQDDFPHARHVMKQQALEFVSLENRARYQAQVQAGMALYVDQLMGLRPPEGRYLSHYLGPKERHLWLLHNAYWALQSADEYVWCYSERMNWWKDEVPEGADQALRQARDKASRELPLGFELPPVLAQGRKNMEAALAARLVRRTAQVRRLAPGEAPPVVDGRLDDAIWQGRSPLEPLLPTAAGPQELEAATAAWLAWDEQNLYAAFRCAEPHLDEANFAGLRKDDAIWAGDVVELFLSAGEASSPYWHFILNPRNLQWDGQSGSRIDDASWDAEWSSATRLGETEWTAELAIPWAALGGAPAADTRRGGNLCRQRLAGGGELSSWSTVVEGFVEPEHFGTWTFAP